MVAADTILLKYVTIRTKIHVPLKCKRTLYYSFCWQVPGILKYFQQEKRYRSEVRGMLVLVRVYVSQHENGHQASAHALFFSCYQMYTRLMHRNTNNCRDLGQMTYSAVCLQLTGSFWKCHVTGVIERRINTVFRTNSKRH